MNEKPNRVLDARPDTLDFRDQMFAPTLVEVPTEISLAAYQKWKTPILNQHNEGACTGFGLATVANYLLRRRKVVPDPTPVSQFMLYAMARRYDEWPGEDYEGSSARGAIKGWHKHGVCTADALNATPIPHSGGWFTGLIAGDSIRRPLGAYYRVNHKDLVAMHSALSEVEILYATAMVHEGWEEVGESGVIPWKTTITGGHAFAIVAYDRHGFWIQNSWGEGWGNGGFGQISYDDWLANGTDVWVARLGAPVELEQESSTANGIQRAAGGSRAYVYRDLRPHIVSLGNDGALRAGGTYGTDAHDVERIFASDFSEVTAAWPKAGPKRLLIYAHGGLVSENAAVQRIADYRTPLLEARVYPVAFIWKTDFWSTLLNILQDALRARKAENIIDATKDFMLDRLDDALEPIARELLGHAQWSEMKENAEAAGLTEAGGARFVAARIAELVAREPSVELHLVGHSAGSILHARFLQALTLPASKGGHGLKVKTCTLWAPACTMELFQQTYVPAVSSGAIENFALFTLSDSVEQDDHCAHIYHKSLLYLVSNAFEIKSRIPLFRDGVPILGMAKFVSAWPETQTFFASGRAEWIKTPNDHPVGDRSASRALSHGSFDDDEVTVKATLARVLGNATSGTTSVEFKRSTSRHVELRQTLSRLSTRG